MHCRGKTPVVFDYNTPSATMAALIPHGCTLGLPRRDGSTNQTIAEDRIRIYEKQTKDLLLAEHVSKASEGGIWEQDQEHNQTDGKPLIECGADDVRQRIGQSPAMNQAHEQLLQRREDEQEEQVHQGMIERRPD